MDVAIGLPATIPGVEREQLLEWARRAEARGFSSLGTLDRIVYPNYEPLIALAAAAAVTERIGLMTAILIAPYRVNAALVAKQGATLHHLSNGRLTLGVAPGGREDDYTASEVDFHTWGHAGPAARGRRQDAGCVAGGGTRRRAAHRRAGLVRARRPRPRGGRRIPAPLLRVARRR